MSILVKGKKKKSGIKAIRISFDAKTKSARPLRRGRSCPKWWKMTVADSANNSRTSGDQWGLFSRTFSVTVDIWDWNWHQISVCNGEGHGLPVYGPLTNESACKCYMLRHPRGSKHMLITSHQLRLICTSIFLKAFFISLFNVSIHLHIQIWKSTYLNYL